MFHFIAKTFPRSSHDKVHDKVPNVLRGTQILVVHACTKSIDAEHENSGTRNLNSFSPAEQLKLSLNHIPAV